MSDSAAAAPSSRPCPTCVHVTTGSRLHFGLLDTAAPFGGAGVMIDEPATEVAVQPAERFTCDAVVADRATAIARRVAERLGTHRLPACRVRVLHHPALHTGLGSGTQLSMSIAEALCRHLGLPVEPVELALGIAARGKRSAVGVHGYFQGGLIYESAARTPDAAEACGLNPVVTRVDVPEAWCVLLFHPPQLTPGVSGETEQQQFSRLAAAPPCDRRALEDLLHERLLPAAAAGDFADFAAAVHQYNYQSGLLFEAVQGGPYNGPQVTALIEQLIRRGAVGVGQSSWGPGVFAWFPAPQAAGEFLARFPHQLGQTQLTTIRNQPREVSVR